MEEKVEKRERKEGRTRGRGEENFVREPKILYYFICNISRLQFTLVSISIQYNSNLSSLSNSLTLTLFMKIILVPKGGTKWFFCPLFIVSSFLALIITAKFLHSNFKKTTGLFVEIPLWQRSSTDIYFSSNFAFSAFRTSIP